MHTPPESHCRQDPTQIAPRIIDIHPGAIGRRVEIGHSRRPHGVGGEDIAAAVEGTDGRVSIVERIDGTARGADCPQPEPIVLGIAQTAPTEELIRSIPGQRCPLIVGGVAITIEGRWVARSVIGIGLAERRAAAAGDA